MSKGDMMKQSRLTQKKIELLYSALNFLETEVMDNQNYSMAHAASYGQARRNLDDVYAWLRYQDCKRKANGNVAE